MQQKSKVVRLYPFYAGRKYAHDRESFISAIATVNV